MSLRRKLGSVRKQPNLSDPDYEPSDEELIQLSREAFAGVAEANARALEEMRVRIAVLRRAALARQRVRLGE